MRREAIVANLCILWWLCTKSANHYRSAPVFLQLKLGIMCSRASKIVAKFCETSLALLNINHWQYRKGCPYLLILHCLISLKIMLIDRFSSFHTTNKTLFVNFEHIFSLCFSFSSVLAIHAYSNAKEKSEKKNLIHCIKLFYLQ